MDLLSPGLIEDPDVSILYSNFYNPVGMEMLQVDFGPKYNRMALTAELEAAIDTNWERRSAQNSTLWNGSKFRLHSFEKFQNGCCVWRVGLTCYKDFLGTNWSPDAARISKLGLNDFGSSQAYMSDPLGVGALVLTADDKVITMKRSANCGEAPGLYDIPGGHPEPEEIGGKKSYADMDLSLFTEDSIRQEIFLSILNEIRDEVNLPLDTLTQPLLLGVALNTQSQLRPSAEFLVRTTLDSTRVTQLYYRGSQSEAEETTEIKLLTCDEIKNIHSSDLWEILAPSAKGCFLLYLSYLNAKK